MLVFLSASLEDVGLPSQPLSDLSFLHQPKALVSMMRVCRLQDVF